LILLSNSSNSTAPTIASPLLKVGVPRNLPHVDGERLVSLDSVQQRLVFQAGLDGLCTRTGLFADQLLSR
jgi:hypothetical protein